MEVYGRELSLLEGTLNGDEVSAGDGGDYQTLSTGNRVGIGSKENRQNVSRDVKIYFKKSDERSDAGQSYVPHFDPTEVTFNEPAPLSMIELVHYTDFSDYAGFIRPVVKSLDYRRFIRKWKLFSH